MRGVFALASAILALAGVVGPCPADAQGLPTFGTSFVTPFPDNDIYRIRVLGDVMADGMLGGLEGGLSGDPRIAFEEGVTRLDYLTRANWDEAVTAIEASSAQPASHIAVVLFAINDRQPVRVPGQRRIGLGTEPWREAYAQRIDRVMKALRAKRTAVYWVGLPIMRREEHNEFAQVVNAIFRERAFRNGIKFIDAYAGFATAAGEYSAYGPDVDGDNTLLRTRDGVYFTHEGYRKLAHFVEREIKRDIAEAVAQRSVPLLGSEAELRRMLPQKAATPAGQPAPQAVTYAGGRAASTASRVRLAPAAPAVGERKAENSRITFKRVIDGREETMSVEIVRPAISAAVLALVARSGTRASRLGDTVKGRTVDGMPVMASVTPSEAGATRALAPTQAPHFKLWARGERTPPRPGRVDDFAWPPAVAAIAHPAPPERPPQAPAKDRARRN
ncbi:MAG: DUF459 domain-containing protein [Hyphomicrobiaceae bacterium]